MITANQVSKKFGDALALDGVSLDVKPGECLGLLGPNGAGKSTFINILYGALFRNSGELTVFGYDPATQSRRIKARLGVVTQDNALDEGLSVEENMLLYAAFQGIAKAERKARVRTLLEFMNLGHKAEAPIYSLSGGMKRRLVFVRALLGNPELLILDEPTTGLDPAVRQLLWQKVRELRKQGTTVLLTTHYIHEAEILCDRVAILNKGKIVSIETPGALIARTVPGYVGIYPANGDFELRLVEWIAKKSEFQTGRDSQGLYVRAPELESLIELQRALQVKPVSLRPSNLEDVFLKLTGKELMADD